MGGTSKGAHAFTKFVPKITHVSILEQALITAEAAVRIATKNAKARGGVVGSGTVFVLKKKKS